MNILPIDAVDRSEILFSLSGDFFLSPPRDFYHAWSDTQLGSIFMHHYKEALYTGTGIRR